jgi:hypothetical protein
LAYNKARKRGDRWSFVVERERDPATGKRRQKWVSGYGTKGEAKKALRASLKVIDDGQYPFPHEVTVWAFVVQRWLPELEPQSGLRARTIENHRELWRDQCAPAHRCDPSGQSPRTPGFDADIDLSAPPRADLGLSRWWRARSRHFPRRAERDGRFQTFYEDWEVVAQLAPFSYRVTISRCADGVSQGARR